MSSKVDLELLKRLSAETSAGLVNCKNALLGADGDYDKARELLREMGHALSAKKAGREAKDGFVGVISDGTFGVMMELNCETDFVARNEKFQSFGNALLKALCDAKCKSVEEAISTSVNGMPVKDAIVEQIAIFKENVVLSRCEAFSIGKPGVVGTYIHNKYTPALGKIAVMVVLETSLQPSDLSTLPEDLAVHIMSESPRSISVDDIPASVLEEEKNRYAEEVKGKPENVADKIMQGKLAKFYKRIALMEQPFCMDNDVSIKQHIDDVAGADSVKVVWYRVFVLGSPDSDA